MGTITFKTLLLFENRKINAGSSGYPVVYRAYPNIVSARWILPEEPVLRKSGVQIYRPGSIKGKVLKAAIANGLVKGKLVPNALNQLSELALHIASLTHVKEPAFAVSFGTEGAYQKATLKVMDSDGNALAYCKLAETKLAQEKVLAEQKTLTNLNKIKSLNTAIPRLKGLVHWREFKILVLEAGPEKPASNILGEDHIRFLLTLAKSTATHNVAFLDSMMWRQIFKRFSDVKAPQWNERIKRCVRYFTQIWPNQKMPLSLAHGDFVPWNMSYGSQGLFVFDWENSIEQASPLFDVFHFNAFQKALRGQSYDPDPNRYKAYLEQFWPDSNLGINTLYLAYLVSVSSFYLEARKRSPTTSDDKLLNWLGKHIDKWFRNNAQ